MRRFDRALWLIIPAATLLALGCEGSGGPAGGEHTTGTHAGTTALNVDSEQAQKAAASAAVAAAATRASRGTTARSGVAGMLIATARESGVLEAQQKDLDKIEQTLGAGPREEHKAFTDDLVAAVKAGTVDPAKLAPRLDALEKALAARRDKELAAITATHKLLTPTQRTALVTTLRSRLGAKPSDAHGKGGFGAELGKRRLERMTTELELDAAQQKKIEAAIGDGKPEETARGDIEKRIDTLLVAFEAELFDASKLDLGDAGKRMREGLDRHLAFVAAVVPVLKPEQRDRFAASLARGPRGMGPDVGLGGFHGDEAAPPPADAKSADAKPADAKSADAKPGDAKSEAKDAKPADAKK